MPRESVKREPLTPREENRRADPAKSAPIPNRSSKISRPEVASRSTAACVSIDAEENDPALAAQHTVWRDEQAGNSKSRSSERHSQDYDHIAGPEVTGVWKKEADLNGQPARLEAREFQMGNQTNTKERENRDGETAAHGVDSNEIVLQSRLNDIEIAMEAEVTALRAEYEAALQQMQLEHDAELHEAHLQSAEESMQHIMTKVSRLQATIAEAAAQVGIKVHWCPPSFPNTDFQEEFEEMGAWLSRLSDTLHELSRERLRLKEAHREEVQRRKEVQADLFDLQGPVQVLCRLHTGTGDEGSNAEPDCSSELPTLQTSGHPVHDPATPNRVKVNSNRYNFQTVFTESDGTDELFKELEPTVLSVLDGHNVCILSHELAQSSSHTTLRGNDMECGLAAWCAEVLFEAAAADPSLTSARLHVSFLEVTESAVYDIMASNPQGRGSKQDQREPWMEFDPKSDNVEAHQQEVEDPEDAADVLQSCFGHRQKHSSTAAACSNKTQAHTLVCITVTTSNEGLEMVSQLWVAGLSGNAVFAAHDGLEESLRQPHNALCSLSSLATCLAVRCQGRQNVPWSESPLTRLLKGGLAPGSRLVVLVNLSEATSVSSRTAASLDWVLHLQSLSRARHMSVHTLYQDDSMTVVGNSMAQIPSIFSRQNAATSDQELPPFLAANADSMALKLLEGPNDCSGPVNDECEKDCDKDKLIAEMEQLKAQVQDLLGENARLKSQVSELTSKQQMLQADAAFMSEYKVNSALARHSLTARCSDLEAELSQVRSALSQRKGCVSPDTMSKQSSQDCGSALGHAGVISATSSLALADTTVLMEAGTVSALLQGDTALSAAPAVIHSAVTATREGTVATTSAHLCTVGESLHSDPTSEDLDTSASPEIASLGTTLDSSRSSDEALTDQDVATQRADNADVTKKCHKEAGELVKDISEDSLIKSSSFSLQPSSVPSNTAGTFHDSAVAPVPKVSSHSGRYAKHAARTYSSDSSRMDSELLAVLSDCPSPSATRADSKKLRGSLSAADGAPDSTSLLQQGRQQRHCYVAPDTGPQEGAEIKRPQVFESLELAHFLEASRGIASDTCGATSSTAPVVPPLLTIPAPPPRFPTHKNTSGLGPSASPKPDLGRVMDSVDLSSFIRCDQETPRDTPRSINVMDSADLTAFMNAEKQCAKGTPGRPKRTAAVMDSVDLSAFIKGEASGEVACPMPGDASKTVSLVDSVDLSNFLKSENSVPTLDLHRRSDQDCKGIDGEESHGRLQCIEEESPGIGISPLSTAAYEEDRQKSESSDKGMPTASGSSSQKEAPQEPCDAAEQAPMQPPSPAQVLLSAASEAGSRDKVNNVTPAVNTVECPFHTAPALAEGVKQLAQETQVTPANAEAEEHTVCLAPSVSPLHHQPQVTPMLGAAMSRNGDAPVDTVATDRLLCDSSGAQRSTDAGRDPAAQQRTGAVNDDQWGGIERLDEDLEEESTADVLSGGPNYSADGSASSSSRRRSSLRLSLGRAGDGIWGLFGSNRRRERGDGSSQDRRWSVSVTPRGVTTPRQLMPAAGATVRTPRQLIPAGEDGSGGALKTPRSVLGSRASIDKLMRSAFKRSTTLLASARRQGRRTRQPEDTSCVHDESTADVSHRNKAQRTSGDGRDLRSGPATPKKLDFHNTNPTAVSPDVGHSNKSLQSSHHSDVSPVLGFINPATIAETAQDAGLTPRGNSFTTAAALARDKLQQEDTTLQGAAASDVEQQAKSKAGNQQEIFSTTAAPTTMPTPRLGTTVNSSQNAPGPEKQAASQLPRSPVVNKTRGNNAGAASQAPVQSPAYTKPADAAEVADSPPRESPLPKSPFSRLRALTSRYKASEHSERPVSSAHTMPIRHMYGQKQHDTHDDFQSDIRAERSETACMNNPHFKELSSCSLASGVSAPVRSDAAKAAPEDDDEVLRGSVTLPFGYRDSHPADDGNTLMLSHDIAPPNASYAWLVNGPSGPSSNGSQKSHTVPNPDLSNSICSDQEHHDGASEGWMDGSDRPRSSPLRKPVPSALAHLHSASTSNLHLGMHTAPDGYQGSSAPISAQQNNSNTQDSNPTEVVRQGRGGRDDTDGITPRTRSKGSYWRRGFPLKVTHKGTALQYGATGGSSRGSSPGEFRSVSPPLPAQMQPSVKPRPLAAASKDQSLVEAASGKAQQSFGRHAALRSAPQADYPTRRGYSERQTQSAKHGKSRADETAREDKGREVYIRRMRELDEVTASFKTPAPMLRDSSTLMTPATSQLKKPPGRVSHAQAAQQMAKANADHKRLMAAASASAKRKGKAWM